MENINNPPALYGCMQSVGSTILSFTEYPYVRKKDGDRLRPPVSLVLEQFVLNQNGPVPIETIRIFCKETLCVWKVLVPHHIAGIPNVIRTHISELVHLKVIGIEKSDLAPIADSLEKRAFPITAGSLYRQHIIICYALGISTPMLLSSLLRHFYPRKFKVLADGAVAEGDFVEPASADAGRDRSAPVAVQIGKYLEDRARPCRTDDVFWYFRDLCSRLPAVAEHISWTSVLLASLLGAGRRCLVFGGLKDILVAKHNGYGIATHKDLIVHVLKTRYHGLASKTAFIAEMRGLGILDSTNVECFILEKDARVVIEGDSIRIR